MALKDIFKGPKDAIKDSLNKSLEWLQNMIDMALGKTNSNTTSTDDQTEIRKMRFESVNYPEMGKLYFFMYHDPLTKATLPYWDKFPVVIFIEQVQVSTGIGFLGLNLHYLPPMARAGLLDALIVAHYEMGKEGKDKKLYLNYEILRSFMTNYPSARICIKKYALSQIMASSTTKGRFAEIHPDDWRFVVTLPLHEWVRNPNYSGSLPW